MGGVLWAPLPTVRLLMLFVLLSLLACPALPFRGPVLVTDSEWWGRSVSAPQGRGAAPTVDDSLGSSARDRFFTVLHRGFRGTEETPSHVERVPGAEAAEGAV